MCENRELWLSPLIEEAKIATTSPILFFQFVEKVEYLQTHGRHFMLDREKGAYPKLWWDMQEVHLTIRPLWQKAN